MAAPWQQDQAARRGSWWARSAEDVTDDAWQTCMTGSTDRRSKPAAKDRYAAPVI
jgi:hypothetical protein